MSQEDINTTAILANNRSIEVQSKLNDLIPLIIEINAKNSRSAATVIVLMQICEKLGVSQTEFSERYKKIQDYCQGQHLDSAEDHSSALGALLDTRPHNDVNTESVCPSMFVD